MVKLNLPAKTTLQGATRHAEAQASELAGGIAARVTAPFVHSSRQAAQGFNASLAALGQGPRQGPPNAPTQRRRPLTELLSAIHLSTATPLDQQRPAKLLKRARSIEKPTPEWCEANSHVFKRLALQGSAFVDPSKSHRKLPPLPVPVAHGLAETPSAPAIHFSAQWHAAIDDIAAERFSAAILRDGMAHVAFGSKPVHYVESGDEDGLWEDLERCAGNARPREGFLLIGAHGNEGLPADERSGFIINEKNSLRAIGENKHYLAQRFGVPPATPAPTLLKDHIVPLLQTLGYQSFQQESELMAIMLGFGRSNASAYLDTLSNDSAKIEETKRQSQAVNEWVERRMEELLDGKETREGFPAIPPFLKYVSPVTIAILERYLQESSQMQDGFQALLVEHEDKTDASEAGDGRILGSALLNALLEPPFPAGHPAPP